MDRKQVGHDLETLKTTVRGDLLNALALARGNQRQAAALLGVSRWKLARMIRRFALRDFMATMRSEGEHVTRTSVAEGACETSRCGHDS